MEPVISQRLDPPAYVYANEFWLGDSVLLEPIARMSALRGGNYILSAYPELFEAHPTIIGISDPGQVPTHTRVIDIRDAIESIEDQDGRQRVLPGKNLRMWEAAGFDRVMDQPRLYLSPAEWSEASRMKRWFKRPCVGVVYRSSRSAKDWAYTLQFIRALVKSRGCDVFVFGKSLSTATIRLMPPGVHLILDRPLRDVMQCISMMDLLIGPDTGLMHIGGALGTECLVVSLSIFSDLYESYERTTILQNDNFTLRKGIMGISLRKVMKEVDRKVAFRRSMVPLATEAPEMGAKNNCYVRFRGLGDVLSSLPGLATARSLDGDSRMTFVTSPGVAELVRLSEVVDQVIEIDYDHSTGGRPVPPRGPDWESYDTVINAINAVDFTPESAEVPRADLFGRLMGIQEVDYSTDWKFTVPLSWHETAQEILRREGVRDGETTILMQADSKGASRQWPTARQDEFVGLATKRGFRVIVASDVLHNRYNSKRVINLTGKLSLSQYVGMIAATSILLCPDSGGLHIAGCTDNLAIGLFGSVKPELRIGHYDTVYSIIGKDKYCTKRGKVIHCNDWQNSSCAHFKRFPKCMWNIQARVVIKKVEEVFRMGREAGAVEEL